MEDVATDHLRLQVELTRIDPVTTKGRTVVVLAGNEVVWQGEVEDAERSNLLPKFAELLVLDVQLPEGSEVGQLLTVVCDVGDRGSTISAVIDAVAKLAGGAAMLGAPVIGTLAAAGLRLGAQSLKAALAPEDAQSVQGTVYLEATRVGDVVRLQACAGHEDYPLLQLDERGDPRVGGDINAVELEMVSGEEVRLMTACHECGDCRVNVYLRVRVA